MTPTSNKKRSQQQQQRQAASTSDASTLPAGNEDALAAVETEAQKAPRKILICLHGKRTGDPVFEEGVKKLKAQGHKVRPLDQHTCRQTAGSGVLGLGLASIVAGCPSTPCMLMPSTAP